MRYRIVSLLLAVFVGISVAAGQSPVKPLVNDPALTRSIDQVLKDISSVQSGMTRAELLRVFTTEGGLSTRDEQQYVYRRCPFIKVMVTFRRPADADDDWGGAPEEERTGDIIQSISKPFLEYSIMN
jgi:hypothetical protein